MPAFGVDLTFAEVNDGSWVGWASRLPGCASRATHRTGTGGESANDVRCAGRDARHGRRDAHPTQRPVARVRPFYSERWYRPQTAFAARARLAKRELTRGRNQIRNPAWPKETTVTKKKPRSRRKRSRRSWRPAGRPEPALSEANPGGYASSGSMTCPCTSVSRRSIPLWRKVSRMWSMPSRRRIVAWMS